jgi:hypothetical protein
MLRRITPVQPERSRAVTIGKTAEAATSRRGRPRGRRALTFSLPSASCGTCLQARRETPYCSTGAASLSSDPLAPKSDRGAVDRVAPRIAYLSPKDDPPSSRNQTVATPSRNGRGESRLGLDEGEIVRSGNRAILHESGTDHARCHRGVSCLPERSQSALIRSAANGTSSSRNTAMNCFTTPLILALFPVGTVFCGPPLFCLDT